MYEEIQEHYPQEFALRDQDKYRYRYPKGEVSVILPYVAGNVRNKGVQYYLYLHNQSEWAGLVQKCVFDGSVILPSVLRGPGAATGACDDGTREAGKHSGHLSPGRHALFSGVFPGQDSRYERFNDEDKLQ